MNEAEWAHAADQYAKIMHDAILAVMRKYKKAEVVIGKAINVDDVKCDLDRGEDSPKMTGVRLNALDEATTTYSTVVPKEGSWVAVSIVEDDRQCGVVVATTEVEKIISKCGEHTTQLFTDGTIKASVNDSEIEITDGTIKASVNGSDIDIIDGTIKSTVGNSYVEIKANSVIAQSGSKSVKVEDSVITLNGTSNEGLVIDAKVLSNLNVLKNYDTVLKGAVSAALATIDLSLGTASATAFNTAMSAVPQTFQDMKNPNVKH